VYNGLLEIFWDFMQKPVMDTCDKLINGREAERQYEQFLLHWFT